MVSRDSLLKSRMRDNVIFPQLLHAEATRTRMDADLSEAEILDFVRVYRRLSAFIIVNV